MTTYYIKKRVSLLDRLTIKDEAGNDCYTVEGSLSLLKNLYLKDMNGSVLAHIKGKWAWRTTFEVYQDGVLNATIRKEFSFRNQLTVEGPNWTISGNWWDTQYEIGDMDGGHHAHISRDAWALMDSYRIDIAPGGPEILMLAIVVAIDAIIAYQRAASS
ncbi:MAG: LURP-one-related family protein [Propionibacteriaceae bacterium]|nr:LURP-one-related family protein [Propionibacteriaceae bacterium]